MKGNHKTSVILVVSILLLCIFIGSCDESDLYLTRGNMSADMWDGDSIEGDDWNNWDVDNDTTPFLVRVQNSLWESTLIHSNEVGCAEGGCYIYQNVRTGEERMEKIEFGEVGANSIRPGNSDPAKNGVYGNDWEVVGYVHSHPPIWCITDGRMRGTGPSLDDQLWADKHKLTVYTIDYVGTYYSSNGGYYIRYDDAYDSPTYLWTTLPR